jgi:hypothetical protein
MHGELLLTDSDQILPLGRGGGLKISLPCILYDKPCKTRPLCRIVV